ncbi:MAG: hypothetical protein ACI9G1_003779 [Pirellulaceae bacterium]|jgi:hypothetical protein
MQRLIRWTGFLLSLAMLAKLAGAREIYVNNQLGDNQRDGYSEKSHGAGAGPVRTLKRALEIASAGDKILLANTGDPYRESVTLQSKKHSGLGSRAFTIDGQGAILDGRGAVPSTAWEGVASDVFRYRPHMKAFALLYLNGLPGEEVKVKKGAEARPKLGEKQWCLFRGHVYFRVEAEKTLGQYNIEHTTLPVGLTLYDVDKVIIVNLIVQGFQLDGINAHDNVFDTRMIGLVSRGNGRSGVSVGGASRVRLEACLIGNNGQAQLRTEGFSRTQVINCDLLENPAPKILQEGGKVFVENDE